MPAQRFFFRIALNSCRFSCSCEFRNKLLNFSQKELSQIRIGLSIDLKHAKESELILYSSEV